MPFGTTTAPELPDGKLDFDGSYQQLIRPAGETAGYEVLRIDELAEPGLLTEQYLQYIVSADLVVADISVPNQNVFYELGVRQAVSPGGTILISYAGRALPFDLSHQRVIFYELQDAGLAKARTLLTKTIQNYSPDAMRNPVRAFLEKVGLTASPQQDLSAFEAALNSRIERARGVDQLIGIWHWIRMQAPLPAVSLTRLAEQLSNKGEWRLAIDVLRRAVKEKPGDFEIHRRSS